MDPAIQRNTKGRMVGDELVSRPRKLPIYHQILDIVKKRLKANGGISILYIGSIMLSRIEQEHGRRIYNDVLFHLKKRLLSMRGRKLRKNDIIAVKHTEGEEFTVFLSARPEQFPFKITNLEVLCDRVATYLNEGLRPVVKDYVALRHKIAVGAARGLYNPLIQEERFIDRVITEARNRVNDHYRRIRMRDKDQLEHLMSQDAITTFFQPIVGLADRSILGYEALSRGMTQRNLRQPYVLFDIAGENDLLFGLDQICRRKAMETAQNMESGNLLFINCLPTVAYDPLFTPAELKKYFKKAKINPGQLVMEVSERQKIHDYSAFRNAIQGWKKMGLSFAIDDLGAGYSSLEAVVELKPRFLKIDRCLISGINQASVKRQVVKAVVTLSNELNATVIAEGIEAEEERSVLTKLGVTHGQGFLFSKPVPRIPGLVDPQVIKTRRAVSPVITSKNHP